MMEDPRNITACTHLLFMAKNLERIGDHATNIAETVTSRHRRGASRGAAEGQRLALCRGERDMSMARRPPRAATRRPASIKPRVLVVEDEAALVDLLRYNLEQQGFRVEGRL